MKKILITAGPTYERIDPVRFIGNYSTGKMGFALAEVCAEAGYEVTLVAGPVQIQLAEEWRDKIHRIDVESAGQMYEQVMKYYPEMDGAISMSPSISQKAISGSIIQNSAKCRVVLECSARKVGPKV